MELAPNSPSFGLGEDPIVHRGVTIGPRQCRRIQRIIDRAADIALLALCHKICQMFRWQRPSGELADRSARNLLLRLDRRGWIRLPPPRSRRICRTPAAPVECEAPWDRWPEGGARHDPSSRLLVRPILPVEREAFRLCLARDHYLGWRRLVGESLGYVAFWEGRPVAVLAWAAASLKNASRDAFIGWDAATKLLRLSLVAQNVRFLIRPAPDHPPHLASRVLGACLRRLSRDWHARYGHPLYLAETFVDESRFQGTCYRAANWQRLGTTRGFGRQGPSYHHHGCPKAVWIYPLRPDAAKRLRSGSAPWLGGSEDPSMAELDFDVERLPLTGEGGLLDVLASIPEFRKPRGLRHPLRSLLALAVLAMLLGCKGSSAIAQLAAQLPASVRQKLGCRRCEAPSEPTFRRVLALLPPGALESALNSWAAAHGLKGSGQALAVDGKALRGSRDGSTAPVHLLGALTHDQGIVVAQQRVPDKTNEIPCVQPLLADLPLEGAMVTADALHTQRQTARFLVEEKNADYLLIAKDNQPCLRADIELLGLTAFPPSARDD